MSLEPIRTRPLLFVVDSFIDEEGVRALLAAVSPDSLGACGVEVQRTSTGLTAEVPVASDPSLTTLAARITALLGVQNKLGDTFRVRHATGGESHPPHLDDYEIDGARLAITAHLYLTDVEGGETPFMRAEPPVAVRARAGRLAVWFNLLADGRADPSSEHAIAPITSGTRTALTWFVYATEKALHEAAAVTSNVDPRPLIAHWPGGRQAAPARRATLHCIVEDRTPDETRAALKRACESRDVHYRELLAGSVDPRRDPLPQGALLYAPATSGTAERVERQLWQPGVITFHRRSEGPFGTTLDPSLAFARAGLPVPRAVWITTTDRAVLRGLLEHVGGLPAIVRVEGGEGGVGVMRADSLPAFFGLVDLLLSRGLSPRLASYVPDAMHYRLIVVGERVVTAYRNPLRPDDFRSEPGGTAEDYAVPVRAEMAELAVLASHVVGSEFVGVDILEHAPTGRLYLLEANFPCYFPQAESFGKADVAGAMIDRLLERRLLERQMHERQMHERTER